MQRLAGDELLRDLPLERGAVRAMLDHGFHPLKAQHHGSIQTLHAVHPEGRTPQQEHLYLGIVIPARPDAASPCRQLALKGRRNEEEWISCPRGSSLPKTLILNRRYLTWEVFSFGFITNTAEAFNLPFEARRHLRPQTLPSLERTMAAAAFYVRCSSRAVSSLGMSSITSCPHASSSCHQRRSPALA